jgi:anti-sigma-K factor RskA
MSELDDIDARAGEYVLGTLDAAERKAVAAARVTDTRLDAAIRAWERRLAPLVRETADAVPPPDLFQRIERDIAATDSRTTPAPTGGQSADIIALQSRVKRWQWATVGATALAATFAGVAVFRDTIIPPKPQSFVAAFVANDELPRFMLTIDLATRELTIRPVGADRLQGKTYQLWIASDQLGPAPRSLGVLDDGSTELQRKRLNDYDPNLLRTATFGVSIEDAGGSRSGRPAAGALHAKLVPAKP